MKDDIIIGTEDDGDKTKGIYRFLLEVGKGRNHRHVKDVIGETGISVRGGISLSEEPYSKLTDDDGVLQTPREIAIVNNDIYCLTKSHLAIITPENRKLNISSQKKLIEILESKVSNGDKLHDIVNEPVGEPIRTDGSMAVTRGNNLFLALFLSDKLKREAWDPDQNKSEKEKGGYLFHAPDGLLENLVEIQEYFPTGKIAADDKRVLIPCGPTLKELTWYPEKKAYIPAGEFKMQGNILASALLDEYTVCTDNKEGFAVGYKNNWSNLTRQKMGEEFQQKGGFSYFRDNFQPGNERAFLPSEATSAAIVKQSENGGNKYYLFLGVDDGKLIIYNLSQGNGRPTAKYNQTISFLSLEKTVDEANKDNHLWNMKLVNDYLSFSLRNMFLQVGIQQILKHNPDDRITIEEEPGEKEGNKLEEKKYLLALHDRYCFHRICKVPHRIRAWDKLP